MKKAFHDNTDGDEIEAQFQEKFTQCMAELRSGFNELIQRRKEYKIAKQSKKSETKTDWKVIKEGTKTASNCVRSRLPKPVVISNC